MSKHKKAQRRKRALPIGDMTCPACERPADDGQGLAQQGQRMPHEGDVACCALCGVPCVFVNNGTGQLRLKLATPHDVATMPMEDQIAMAMAMRAVAATKKPLVFN